MRTDHLAGTSIPRFTYDTPWSPGNDFFDLCGGEKPLAMIFLPAFDHPITRAYLTRYLKSRADLVLDTSFSYEVCLWGLYTREITATEYADRLQELCRRYAAFDPLPGTAVPQDSMLREFIGGGCFQV